jgi:hypothetical protein
MAEWGFADVATAQAYLRRQQHSQRAAARRRREQVLRDPVARLLRLQNRLGEPIATQQQRVSQQAAPSRATGCRSVPSLRRSSGSCARAKAAAAVASASGASGAAASVGSTAPSPKVTGLGLHTHSHTVKGVFR